MGTSFIQAPARSSNPSICAEAKVAYITDNPKGDLYVAAPLGVGRRLIAPQVPGFLDRYPEVNLRLRLTDRKVDLTTEGLDLAFFLGQPEDSNLRIRKIADVDRVLCASPDYVAARGCPASGDAIMSEGHECLNLRFPGATEFRWQLQTDDGPRRFTVPGRYECDDGDVLTEWALAGHGIALKPIFEVAEHLKAGRLMVVARDTPPTPIQMACLYTHRRRQDPKTRLFMDFVIERVTADIRSARRRGSASAVGRISERRQKQRHMVMGRLRHPEAQGHEVQKTRGFTRRCRWHRSSRRRGRSTRKCRWRTQPRAGSARPCGHRRL